MFGIIIIAVWGLLSLLLASNQIFWQLTIWSAVAAVVILGGTILIWYIVAKVKQGNNCLKYSMDPQQIRRILTEEQIRRDQRLGTMNSIAGFFGTGPNSHNAAHLGTQLESGAYRRCEFDKVVSVKCIPKYDKFHVRDIDKTMEVYAGPEDYEKVKQYMILHAAQGVKVKP